MEQPVPHHPIKMTVTQILESYLSQCAIQTKIGSVLDMQDLANDIEQSVREKLRWAYEAGKEDGKMDGMEAAKVAIDNAFETL